MLKDYISDIKIVNDFRKRETKDEKKDANNNSKSIIKNSNTDSSQNLYNNNVASKTNNSIHPILTLNNSFLFLNSSLNSNNVEKLEGLIFECRWKKKYILLLKILKVHDSEQFFKSIDIERNTKRIPKFNSLITETHQNKKNVKNKFLKKSKGQIYIKEKDNIQYHQKNNNMKTIVNNNNNNIRNRISMNNNLLKSDKKKQC